MLRKVVMYLMLLAVGLLTVASIQGCGGKNPMEPQATQVAAFDLVPADTTQSQISKPGATLSAIPPSFSGWSVVSGRDPVLFGPLWDQDWKFSFYLPNRSTKPRYINIAAKNVAGTWSNYTAYVLLYDQRPYGSYYKMTYVIGGGKAAAFGINMFDASNWALYYHD